MSNLDIKVLKFGSSALPSADHLHLAVHEIFRWWRQGKTVVAVASAMGNTTDGLLQKARKANPEQDDEALAELLATGESETVALLNLALVKAGIPSRALDAARLGIRTEGALLDATPISLDVEPILERLRTRPVLVVPGFVGRHEDGRLSLLGRGGSDLTALFLAHHLENSGDGTVSSAVTTSCRLLKDVPGLFTWDPACPGPKPDRYQSIRFDDAAKIDGQVLQKKALQFAAGHDLKFEVGRCGEQVHTLIGEEITKSIAQPIPPAPLRVSLLGLGTVGSGVYHYLRGQADKFEITDVFVRDPKKHREIEIGSTLLKQTSAQSWQDQNDVVVELVGSGAGFGDDLLRLLDRGDRLITADKEFLAARVDELEKHMIGENPSLRFSAAAAGVVPAIETVRRLALGDGVLRIEAVLNGTSNFILQQLTQGNSFEQSIQKAQKLGYAEADPSADLEGWDACRKLSLLIREAWGVHLSPEKIPCQGIVGLCPDDLHDNGAESQHRRTLRLVACAEHAEDGSVIASVKPTWLLETHPLARAQGVGNAIVIEDGNGLQHTIHGAGAGRWPTAEAVFADLMDLWRERSSEGEASKIQSQEACA